MSLTFHIKNSCLIFTLLFFTSVFSQSENESNQEIKHDLKKLGFGSIEYVQPITTGDNFFGLGMKGKSGFNVKAQFFLYEHFFIQGNWGVSYFSVKDKSVVGNYDKTTLSYQYISLGYEFLSSSKIRMGLSLSVFGESRFKNHSFTNTREAFQFDDGNVRSYEVYFDYMINSEFAIYVNYGYRNDKMKIQVPSEIQSLFNNASFHNISIGVKLYFGQSNVFPDILN